MSINIENISFFYNQKQVLKDISFKIPRNELWALLGRSGVGKTTLLHIICGIYRPKEGSVLVENRKAGLGSIRGVVFQDECLLDWLTVEQNVLFPNHRTPLKEHRERGRRILEGVGLINYLSALPNELSTGMRKRLEFARALIVDKEYILADEPFGTVDVATRMNLWELWINLRKEEPRTGILCTHDPEEAIRLCDTIIILKSGDSAAIGNYIKIPETIKAMNIKEQNEYFWQLKKKVIDSF